MRPKTVKRFLIAGIPLLGLIYVAFESFSSESSESERNSEHLIEERKIESNLDTAGGDSIPVPGVLVCRVKKDATKPVLEFEGDGEGEIILGGGAPIERIGAIGCCPPGEKSGKPYKSGFACCADKFVHNATTHFCCESKQRTLKEDPEERSYCLGQYCRLKDLGRKSPMTARCAFTKTEPRRPHVCRLGCPSGSVPRFTESLPGSGTDKMQCEENGTWDKKPLCCEGCPEDFVLDLWLVVEAGQHDSESELKEYIVDMLSYLPVSQDGVRVGITIFNSAVLDGGWDLSAHKSHRELTRGVKQLTFQDSGSNTGEALSWVATNAFTTGRGDRDEVDNQVVLILRGKPEDDFHPAVEELRKIAKVIAIGTGDGISRADLKAIGPDDFHLVESFVELELLDNKRTLYRNVCGEGCRGKVDLQKFLSENP